LRSEKGDDLSIPELSRQQIELVERIGVLHDRLGFSPAPGRVVGLLMVSLEPELTFDEIRDALGLSKSSTSAAINVLLSLGSIEYRTRPGDRKRYFRKSYKNWEASLLERMDLFFSLREPLGEALELEGRSEESRRALSRVTDFLGFLETEIHEAFKRWEKQQAQGG
jgi:DNA-binding transcriptional regulator GbsR (MarR family)